MTTQQIINDVKKKEQKQSRKNVEGPVPSIPLYECSQFSDLNLASNKLVLLLSTSFRFGWFSIFQNSDKRK